MTKSQRLTAKRLNQIWLSIEEEERLAFLGALSPESSDELLTFQMRERERRQTKGGPKRKVDAAPVAQSWPSHLPMDQWDDTQLHAFLDATDAESAAAPEPSRDTIGEQI